MVSSAPPPYVKDNDELQDFILDMFLKFDADESATSIARSSRR